MRGAIYCERERDRERKYKGCTLVGGIALCYFHLTHSHEHQQWAMRASQYQLFIGQGKVLCSILELTLVYRVCRTQRQADAAIVSPASVPVFSLSERVEERWTQRTSRASASLELQLSHSAPSFCSRVRLARWNDISDLNVNEEEGGGRGGRKNTGHCDQWTQRKPLAVDTVKCIPWVH